MSRFTAINAANGRKPVIASAAPVELDYDWSNNLNEFVSAIRLTALIQGAVFISRVRKQKNQPRPDISDPFRKPLVVLIFMMTFILLIE